MSKEQVLNGKKEVVMNKEKLFDVYTHFVGEGNKSRLKGTIAGDTDALICSRIAEMLWLMYKKEGGSNE